MIADLKPYSAYKDSGLPWLGNVPAHWGLVPNRGLVRRRKVLVGERHGEYRLLSLTKQGVIVRDISTGKGKFSSNMGTSQEVRSGDLVFCLFDVPETPRTVGLSRHDGMITGAYTVFESLGRGSVDYFELFYRAMDDRKLLSPLYSGLRNTIPAERFLGTKSPQPSLEEQAAIVRFLDWANGRLERAIRAKRKVISLLDEQKQLVIHDATTGDRSSTWQSVPLRAILRPIRRTGFSEKVLLSLFRDFGVIPKDSRENKNADVRDLELCQLVKVGDVVMNKMKAWQGSIAVSPLEGIVSPDYMVLEFTNEQYDRQFFHYLLRSPAIVAEYRRLAYGVRPGQWRLMYPDFCRLHLSLPGLDEQIAIARSIQAAFAGIDNATAKVRKEVSLLREYRTRLIADVVTGQLDVREAAAHLPDEAPLDAPEDDVDLSDEIHTADEEATA